MGELGEWSELCEVNRISGVSLAQAIACGVVLYFRTLHVSYIM